MKDNADGLQNMKPKWKIRNAVHGRRRAKVILYATTFIATGTAGFLLGGVAGAAAAVGVWAAVVIAWWLRPRSAPPLPEPVKQQQFSVADIEDALDRVDNIARERNWDLRKRLNIALMVCEHRTMTIDELERRYDEKTKGKTTRS